MARQNWATVVREDGMWSALVWEPSSLSDLLEWSELGYMHDEGD